MSEESKSGRIAPDEQLLLAVQRGSVEDCKKILNSGYDVNHKDRNGNTIIFLCNTVQQSKLLRFFISAGAQVNCVDNTGNTPLHYATERGSMEIALILLLHGADLTITNLNKQKAEDLNPKMKPILIAISLEYQAYQHLTENQKKKLSVIFDDIDGDGSGILNLDKSIKFNRYMEDITAEAARKDAIDFLRDVGICHAGQVNLDEWLFSFGKLVSERGSEALEQFFEDYDRIGRERCKFVDFTLKD